MRVRSTIRPSFLASLILLLSASLSISQDSYMETAAEVPAGVHHVSSGGYWSDKDVEGFYRVMVIARGVEHVSHRLFVQWLRSDASTQAYTVVRTVDVKELDLGQGYVFGVTTAFGDLNAFKIAVTARRPNAKEKSFMITAKDVGQYDIRGL